MGENPGGAKRRDFTIRRDVVKQYLRFAGAEHQTTADASGRTCLLDDLGDTPRFGLGDRGALFDLDQVAGGRFQPFNVGVVFLRARHDLADHGVLPLAFDQNRNGFLHLVRNDATLEGAPHGLCVRVRHFAAAFSR